MTHPARHACMPIDLRASLAYNSPVRLEGARSGFTLTEVLIAMGILAIGAVSALSLFAAAAATQKRAVDRVKSAFMADEVIASVEAQLSGDVDLADLEVQGGTKVGFPRYTYDVDLTTRDELEIEVFVEVTVRWESKGAGHEKVYRTILLRSLGEGDYLGGQ